MAAPAARIPAARITLRPVRASDDPFLFDLYARSRHDFQYVAWSSPAERARTARLQFEAQRKDYRRRYPQSAHQVVQVTGAKGGGARRVGRLWTARTPDALKVLDLNLVPAYQSRGIGTTLLRRTQAQAKAAGLPVVLHVLATNARAAQLYRRLGFEVTAHLGSHLQMQWHPAMDRLSPGGGAAGILFSSR